MMNGCGAAWYASCSLGSQSGLNLLREPWEKMEREGRLPNSKDNVKYKVYSIRSEKLGAAMSLVFTHDDENFISVSLCITQGNEHSQSFLRSQELDKGIAWKLKLHGELTTTSRYILRTLIKTWKEFGDYIYLTNNCQHFASSALKAFGLPNAPITDTTFVAGAGIAGIVVVGIAALVGAVLGKK